eukprot:403348207
MANPIEIVYSWNSIKQQDEEQDSQNVLMVNISPLYPVHFLVIPRINILKPQYLDSNIYLVDVMELYSKLDVPDNYFIGYNSVGASSTINHLHFQIFNKRLMESQTYTGNNIANTTSSQLYLENVKTIQIIDNEFFPIGVYHKELLNGFCITPTTSLSSLSLQDLELLSLTAYKIINLLNHHQQPYNLVLTNSKIHIIPRQPDGLIDKDILSTAFLELYGALIIKSEYVWNEITKDMREDEIFVDRKSYGYQVLNLEILQRIQSKVCLQEEIFQQYVKELLQ